MARVQCGDHGPPAGRKVAYSATPYEPVGHPNSGLVCGLTDCRSPGLVWLSTDEERDYGIGERIFGLQGNLKDAKFRVSVPHRTSTTVVGPVLDNAVEAANDGRYLTTFKNRRAVRAGDSGE